MSMKSRLKELQNTKTIDQFFFVTTDFALKKKLKKRKDKTHHHFEPSDTQPKNNKRAMALNAMIRSHATTKPFHYFIESK